MTTKFTPAPWVITVNKLNVKNVELNKIICFTSNETTYNESEANAKLIAKAPDMYTFIERLVNCGSSMNVLDMVEEGQKLLEKINE